MKNFTIRYLTLMPLFFGLFFWTVSPVARFINHYQTKLALWFLGATIDGNRVDGADIWINPHYKLYITNACNGMIPILVLASAIVAYSTKWSIKIVWLVIGYVVFTLVNFFRLYSVSMLVKNQKDFHFYHDILGNALLIVVGLILFWLFLSSANAQRVTR